MGLLDIPDLMVSTTIHTNSPAITKLLSEAIRDKPIIMEMVVLSNSRHRDG